MCYLCLNNSLTPLFKNFTLYSLRTPLSATCTVALRPALPSEAFLDLRSFSEGGSVGWSPAYCLLLTDYLIPPPN